MRKRGEAKSLRQVVDEIEVLKREEIALLRDHIEVVDAAMSLKTLSGRETKDRAMAREIMRLATHRTSVKRTLESAEDRLPKKLAELRPDVEEYTDAELPMLDFGVRWEKTEAENAVEHAKEMVE